MTYEEAVRQIPNGKYRHFKGKCYEVIDIAINSETCEPVVIYRQLYGQRRLWARPASMWNDIVDCNGCKKRRFTRYG